MKKLGFGCMRLPLLDPEDASTIDDKQFQDMADLFIKEGFTYFDTAYMYHDFSSEKAVGRNVIARHDRNTFTIASKMPLSLMKSGEEAEEIFNTQKERLGVDYFDYYLLHNMTYEKYLKAEKWGVIDFLNKKKEAGEIKKLGFSCHDNAEAVDRILTAHPELDFVQLQINYLDWDSVGIQSRLCYEVCVKHDKPVIVMEPVKGGSLVNLPEEAIKLMKDMHPDWSPASWAIRFAASLENVMMVLSGMSNIEQMKDNISYMKDFKPLNEEEMKVIWKVRDLLNQWYKIPCTSCRYCVETNHCPMNICIPNYFALYNAKVQGEVINPKRWVQEQLYYDNFVRDGYGKASECLHCRMCESVCPQHIEISEWMTTIAETFE